MLPPPPPENFPITRPPRGLTGGTILYGVLGAEFESGKRKRVSEQGREREGGGADL